jgi:uncharacterized membrane protein HdeD (DUF308 family)
MLSLPPWVPLLVGVLVIVFGLYRLRLSFRSPDEDQRARERGGMYGFPRRTHLLFGIVYLLMGGMLVASAFGVKLTTLLQ